jgi:hypothetical protein
MQADDISLGEQLGNPIEKMPKRVREFSAVSGPEWPAIHSSLPTLSSVSWASFRPARFGAFSPSFFHTLSVSSPRRRDGD